jgi:hypothetical protein
MSLKWSKVEAGWYRTKTPFGFWDVVNMRGESVRFSGSLEPCWEIREPDPRWPGSARVEAVGNLSGMYEYTMKDAKARVEELIQKRIEMGADPWPLSRWRGKKDE